MPDLTPERIARLRTWATRHDANRPEIDGTHDYDGACPWCRADHRQPGHDGYFDGNAHDLAIELLDEIERLRSDLAALVEVDAGAVSDETAPVIHLCPRSGSSAMSCCGRTPFEVPPTDRMTLAPSAVTCTPTAAVTSGGMATDTRPSRIPGDSDRYPVEPDKVVDLMAALERSITETKAARQRHPQPALGDLDA